MGSLSEKKFQQLISSTSDEFAILSAARPGSSKSNKEVSRQLQTELIKLVGSSNVIPLRGQWLSETGMHPEQSYLAVGLPFKEAIKLGSKYRQDAVIFKDVSGNLGMYYTNGTSEVLMSAKPGLEGVKMKPRSPKDETRGSPADDEYWTKSRDLSFEIDYGDWSGPKVPYADKPVTAQRVPGTVPAWHPNWETSLPAEDNLPEDFESDLELEDEPGFEPDNFTPEWTPHKPPELPLVEHEGYAEGDLTPNGGSNPIVPGAGLDNIMQVMSYATPEEVDYWANWYPAANEEAKELARNFGVTPEVAAGVIAVTSPNNKWELNLQDAENILGHYKEFDPETGKAPNVKTVSYPANVKKALRIIETGDPWAGVSGPKVTVFYESIIDPASVAREIVLDGHAMNIWRGDTKSNLGNMKMPTKQERAQMLKDYQEAAKAWGMSPQQLQAVSWSVWRPMKKKKLRSAQLMEVNPAIYETIAELTGLPLETVLALRGQDRTASTMKFRTEAYFNGSLPLDKVASGERVHFEKPYYLSASEYVPVDSLGTVTYIDRPGDWMEVSTKIWTQMSDGTLQVKRGSVTLRPSEVKLVLSSQDPRVSAYRVDKSISRASNILGM